jgi:SAM-dependent methyltransferase
MEDNYEQWLQEEKTPISGWDFSYLGDRVISDSPSWDYQSIAKEYLLKAKTVLEMATGGGERFSELAPFPNNTIAIEGYSPNYLLAKNKLEPLGVKVLEMKGSGILGFEDNSFDLVLNRHGGFNYSEIARVLKPNGYFVTQQVSADNWSDLRQEFNAHTKWPDRLPNLVAKELEKAGMVIERLESWKGNFIFKDVGALVFMLKAVPWTVDGFSVSEYRDVLEKLKRDIENKGELTFTDSKYLIIAKKKV